MARWSAYQIGAVQQNQALYCSFGAGENQGKMKPEAKSLLRLVLCEWTEVHWFKDDSRQSRYYRYQHCSVVGCTERRVTVRESFQPPKGKEDDY